MPKKKRQRKPDRGRGSRAPRTPLHGEAPPRDDEPRRPAGQRDAPADDEPELLGDVRRTLDDGDVVGLLSLASALLDATDPRNADPFATAEEASSPGPDRDELIASFVDVDLPETTALLAALAEVVDDEAARTRMRDALSQRSHRLPRWLAQLGPVSVRRAAGVWHVLGDGDTVLLEARTGAGDAMTALVYIDHNFGTVVKDAFVVAADVDDVGQQLTEATDDDPDTTIAEVDPAGARARVEDAIDAGAITYPPMESETWPSCRPLVEALLRSMPPGGTGFAPAEWDEDAREELAERFFASPLAAGCDAEDRQLFDSLVWFACDYGSGDPLRWSATRVEILLGDWLPRKVIADATFLARAPDLLRRFVAFAHAEAGIRQALTDEALAAIDSCEPEYLDIIRQPRPQGPAALLAAMGVDVDLTGDVGAPSHREAMLARLAADVGGQQALAALDVEGLGDEGFAWHQVPAPATERAGELLGLVDRACDALLDVECRTATRRLLADVAAADATALQRGRADTAAAALVWIVAKANERFSYGGLTAKALWGWFGVSSGSQRAGTLLQAIGAAPQTTAGGLALGTPRYLTAARRQAIVERRDRYQAMAD